MECYPNQPGVLNRQKGLTGTVCRSCDHTAGRKTLAGQGERPFLAYRIVRKNKFTLWKPHPSLWNFLRVDPKSQIKNTIIYHFAPAKMEKAF